jgi:hypothetical protein
MGKAGQKALEALVLIKSHRHLFVTTDDCALNDHPLAESRMAHPVASLELGFQDGLTFQMCLRGLGRLTALDQMSGYIPDETGDLAQFALTEKGAPEMPT